jgi:hypothetical protein
MVWGFGAGAGGEAAPVSSSSLAQSAANFHFQPSRAVPAAPNSSALGPGGTPQVGPTNSQHAQPLDASLRGGMSPAAPASGDARGPFQPASAGYSLLAHQDGPAPQPGSLGFNLPPADAGLPTNWPSSTPQHEQQQQEHSVHFLEYVLEHNIQLSSSVHPSSRSSKVLPLTVLLVPAGQAGLECQQWPPFPLT